MGDGPPRRPRCSVDGVIDRTDRHSLKPGPPRARLRFGFGELEGALSDAWIGAPFERLDNGAPDACVVGELGEVHVGEVRGAMRTPGGEFDDLSTLAITAGTHEMIVARTAFRPLMSPCCPGNSRKYRSVVEFRVLGPLEIRDDSGRPVAVPGGRQRTLLALLVLNSGRVTPADRLIDELWGKDAPREPANALQVAVFKLRRVLGGELIETRAPGYLLDVAAESVDAHRFERFVAQGRRALAEGRTDAAIDDFDRALAEWRGDALAEFGDVRTPSAVASRLEELRAAVVEDRFAALLAAGHAGELVPELDVAIAAAPLREGLRCQLMLALYRSGRQADALRAFREARRVLVDEVGVEPGKDLRQLEAAILAQDPSLDAAQVARPAPISPPPTAPTYVRTPLTSFVGRQRDVETVRELLNGHRLVTLVGAGGCGKTRLATELAMAATAGFPGGVWFVPLETLGAGGDVSDATAAALGLSTGDTAGQPALATTGIVDRLRGLLTDRTALMVLDNCEHVIEAAARLANDLLSAAPGLHVLATSREALRIPGETVWSVPPLDVDDAVALFAERAQAAAPEFELSDRGRVVVGELCHRLDGMPLAIELIAARARVFTVDQLAERLDDRFRLLTGGARTALPRQQTLRAVTDWSYDLLFEDERAVFERLSVFAGGCTLEAAESICADGDIPTAEVGDVIGRLVDKSLVIADGSGRYRLLLTFIHYGHERLAETADGETVRDRHAAFFRELGVASYGHMRRSGGPSHTWWLASLTTELDNIRVALEWSIACRDGLSAQLLAGHMGWYWWQSGRIVEGYSWLERALGCASPTPAAARAPAVTWAARLGMQLGHTARATELVSEAVPREHRGKRSHHARHGVERFRTTRSARGPPRPGAGPPGRRREGDRDERRSMEQRDRSPHSFTDGVDAQRPRRGPPAGDRRDRDVSASRRRLHPGRHARPVQPNARSSRPRSGGRSGPRRGPRPERGTQSAGLARHDEHTARRTRPRHRRPHSSRDAPPSRDRSRS